MQTQHLSQEELAKRQDLPFLLLRRNFFSMMLDSLIKNYGSAGISMIFTMGKDRGIGEVREYRGEYSQYSTPLSKMELVDKVFIRLNQMGWGKLHVETYDPDTGILQISIKLNPFIEKCGSESNGGCIFLQGLITGIVSEALEKDMSISNPHCLKSPGGSCNLSIISNSPTMLQ